MCAHLWAGHLFGILNLNNWDLFEFWDLVLGIFIRKFSSIQPANYCQKQNLAAQ